MSDPIPNTLPVADAAVPQSPKAPNDPAAVLSWRPTLVGLNANSSGDVLAAYAELTKPRLTAMILLVVTAGFWLASSGSVDAPLYGNTIAAIALLAGGIFALNQYLERDVDGLMCRTEGRPLPAGRLRPASALIFGLLASATAIALLATRVNPLTAWLGGFTFVTYVLVYTPLKRRTPHCTFWGAIPGAMPPLIGWAAATGEIGAGAAVLFLVLFSWQFPHFHSIGWLYREDYARAGIKMWPVVQPSGEIMGREIVGYALLLLAVSAGPTLLGISGPAYFVGALLLGLGILYLSLNLTARKTKWRARRLLIASVVYLPVLFALMVLDR